MLEALNKKLKNNVNNLPKIIAISTFLTDVACLYYINNYWLKTKLNSLITMSFNVQGVSNVSPSTMKQAQAVLGNSLGTMFFFFLMWHLFIYILMFFKKEWAINYVYRYVFLTIVLTLFEFAALIQDFTPWFIFLFLITMSYGFTYLGLKEVRRSLARSS